MNDVDAKETLDRVRRIETRITKGFTSLGVDVTDNKHRVFVTTQEDVVGVSGFDVSFTDVVAFCRKSGIRGTVYVSFHGTQFASVWLDSVKLP